MTGDDADVLEQVDRHLACAAQSWLFGAGISKDAKIPLMAALTEKIFSRAAGTEHEKILTNIQLLLPDLSNIEQILSHLIDFTALAERSKDKSIVLGTKLTVEQLQKSHAAILGWIAETVRWGYAADSKELSEREGSRANPIVNVEGHVRFVGALFNRARAGLEQRRQAVRLFTTNYDTLLEDALSLQLIPYWDGFYGGAVGFRSYHFGQDGPSAGYRAHLIKLHGSIDWYVGEDGRVWRVRDDDTYPKRAGRVLIYPQSTKYLATQRDPFAAQFDLFRRALATSDDNILAICGYSFGDDHINEEIELAIGAASSRTTLLAFSFEGAGLAQCLERWRTAAWGRRIYIITEKGIYVGKDGPFFKPNVGQQRNWWSFAGLSEVLMDGIGAKLS